jgi:hypothetical protein
MEGVPDGRKLDWAIWVEISQYGGKKNPMAEVYN